MGGSSYRNSESSYSSPIRGSYGSGSGSEDDCSNLQFTTTLQSPNSSLNEVEEGDMLSVISNNNVVHAVNSTGDICGNIVSGSTVRLIACIEKGAAFRAAVLRKQNLTCEVRIESENG